MARTSITPTKVTNTGVNQSVTAGTVDGHQFANSGREFVVLKNNNIGQLVVTIPTSNTVEGLAIDDADVTIPAAATRTAGPFGPGTFNQSDGTVWINFPTGDEADIDVQVYTLPKPG